MGFLTSYSCSLQFLSHAFSHRSLCKLCPRGRWNWKQTERENYTMTTISSLLKLNFVDGVFKEMSTPFSWKQYSKVFSYLFLSKICLVFYTTLIVIQSSTNMAIFYLFMGELHKFMCHYRGFARGRKFLSYRFICILFKDLSTI